MKFVVAIDGPAAAGKGTIGRRIAERFGFAHLDTGMLYRAVGKRTIDAGRGVIDEGMAEIAAKELTPADLERDDLRTILVARAASKVAAFPGVRKALLDFQRKFARQAGGAVLDGRDIGTVICPDADVKLYVTASAEERARRRHAELTAKGEETSLERVLADVHDRDQRDAGRADAPMRQAKDAVLLDTTGMDIDTAVATAAEIIEQALSRAGR
jgi:cytidylate kinase